MSRFAKLPEWLEHEKAEKDRNEFWRCIPNQSAEDNDKSYLSI
jgi:hypothetical protein